MLVISSNNCCCWILLSCQGVDLHLCLPGDNALVYKTGLHKLQAQLRLCTWRGCKRRFTYTKICAQYWLLCIKIIWICQSLTQTIYFMKIRTTTTTAFLISNIVVSYSKAFHPPSFAPLSSVQVLLIW